MADFSINNNEEMFLLSDDSKYICDLVCRIGNMSKHEFINMVINFYGKFLYQKLSEIAFTDVPITKS